jgi:hypothetical protein
MKVKIPTTVEEMGNQLKKIADGYTAETLTFGQAYADLQFLMAKSQDLFLAAMTIRWVGKKRLKLLQSITGDIQLTLYR